MVRRKRFSLMPMIALGALSLMVALPTLSTMHLYAAGSEHFATITVRPGDSLWSIAAGHVAPETNVQETVDRIAALNHLEGSALLPGQHLRIPK